MKFENVRGMRDFLSEDLAKRRLVEDKIRECFRLYGYDEIETPIVESLQLLATKAGNEIRHRLYTFKDHGGRKVALRPEMTAPVARVVSRKLRSQAKPLRLGYVANCFRYDNPQMGRYREFWQAGFELFGLEMAEADSEIIVVFHDLMRKLGFSDFIIKLGHVGVLRALLCSEGVEEKDQNLVMGFLDKRRLKRALSYLTELRVSADTRAIIKRLIALRGTTWTQIIARGKAVLDGNNEAFESLQNLEEIIYLSMDGGVKSTILADLGFARGLEYYTGMIFEVFVPNLRIALGGGGRYDKLVELFGGEPTPAVGCSPGIDRLVLAIESEGRFTGNLVPAVEVLVIPIGDELIRKALGIAAELRRKGISAQVEISGRGVSSALSYADKKGFPVALIIGSREIDKGSLIVRDMKSKMQREVPIAKVSEIIKEIGAK